MTGKQATPCSGFTGCGGMNRSCLSFSAIKPSCLKVSFCPCCSSQLEARVSITSQLSRGKFASGLIVFTLLSISRCSLRNRHGEADGWSGVPKRDAGSQTERGGGVRTVAHERGSRPFRFGLTGRDFDVMPLIFGQQARTEGTAKHGVCEPAVPFQLQFDDTVQPTGYMADERHASGPPPLAAFRNGKASTARAVTGIQGPRRGVPNHLPQATVGALECTTA